MTKQERIVAIAVLIPFMFGLQVLLTDGAFIFPFPLNEFIFFAAAIIFAIQLYKFRLLESIFSTAFALFQLLSAELFWTFFLSGDQLEGLSDGPILGLVSIIAYSLLIIWAGVALIRPSDKFRSLIFIGFIGLLSAGLIFRAEHFIVAGSLLPFIAHFKYKELAPYHLLWLLFAILETMRLVMLSWTI